MILRSDFGVVNKKVFFVNLFRQMQRPQAQRLAAA
jgi:hypothetical protein